MGPGWIAARFVESVQKHSRQHIAAVGSRSLSRSQAFASQHGVGAAYGSYQELVQAEDVDIIYVATPHNKHRDDALLALNAGKRVLVEKPMGISAEEVTEIARVAEARGLFAAEALWTMFLPKFDVVRQVLEQGLLGEVVAAFADYGEHFSPDHRIFDADLAGGPLFDLGTYPLSFLVHVLGKPESVLAAGTDHSSGVNGQLSAILTTADGRQGSMTTNLYNFTPTMATVVGTEGVLTLEGSFHLPGPLQVRFNNGQVLRYEELAGAHFEGLHFEAADVARCIARGELQAWKRPLQATIQTMGAADEILRQLKK